MEVGLMVWFVDGSNELLFVRWYFFHEFGFVVPVIGFIGFVGSRV